MKPLLLAVLISLTINSYTAAAVKDTTPPAKVEDLTAFGSSKIVLEWTSIGNDGTAGAVKYYEIRYSSNQTYDFEQNWGTAKIWKKVKPKEKSNKIEKVIINNLNPGVTYYIALKAVDEAGNISGLSNTTTTKKDINKANIYYNRGNNIFYAELKKDYKTAANQYLKALYSGAAVKGTDLYFKLAYCLKQLKDKQSRYYFNKQLENQEYYYLIKDSPDNNTDIVKYNDFLAGISFVGNAFTIPSSKDQQILSVPDIWVQKLRNQGIYFMVFYLVDYAYCYGEFPEYFSNILVKEKGLLNTAASGLNPAYVNSAIAAHYLIEKKYKNALKYYKNAFADSMKDYTGEKKSTIAVLEISNKYIKDRGNLTNIIIKELEKYGIYTIIKENNAGKKSENNICDNIDCAVKAGRLLNAKNVMISNISNIYGRYQVNVKLINVDTREILFDIKQESLYSKEIYDAIRRIALDIIIGSDGAKKDYIFNLLGTIDKLSKLVK
jgi:hypothetical protein